MSLVTRGEIYWLYPEDENALAKLGLVLESDEHESLFMMCHPDVRLAGHLDAIFEPQDTGLAFAVAAFTHVVLWFQHKRISPAAIGKVSLATCDELEKARAGDQFENLKCGFHLADPVIEPRWPLIEQIVTEFIEDLSFSASSDMAVHDERSFSDALERAIREWYQDDLAPEQRERIRTEVMGLGEVLQDNPQWCDEYTFFMTTEIILGSSVLSLAA
jgi:hypothetical protein